MMTKLAAKHCGFRTLARLDSPYDRVSMKTLTLPLLLTLSLAGCAKISDLSQRALSSTAPALAVVNETLLSGEVEFFINRTGNVRLQADSGLKCMGGLRYTASRAGAINLQCSDGSDVKLEFVSLSETRGHASGRSAQGPATLVYGLEPTDAAAYLTLPPGKRLVTGKEGGVRLQ